MSGHTPGPWSYGNGFEACDPEDQEAQRKLHPDWREIFSSWSADYKRMFISGHVGEANARLIAAAPELLEALIAAVENRADDAYWIAQARSAIAKATGVQP
jgi:hypothetical protein